MEPPPTTMSIVSSTTTAADRSPIGSPAATTKPSRYESQKRRDWQTFGQYLRNHRPPLELSRCSGAHVLEFLRYLDQFGKTKVHSPACPFFGHPAPPAPCPCPLRQAWGSLDALVGRLRAAFEEHGGRPEDNPFGARSVRLYLRDVRDTQARARGIAYTKKPRRRRHNGNNKTQHANKTTTTTTQQEQEHHHQCHHAPPAAAAAAAAAPDDMERRIIRDGNNAVPELAPPPHFLIPHAHFFHGHHFFPPPPPTTTTHYAAADHGPPVPAGVGVAAGEDVAMAMAEAHAAGGCMTMPLSVFY
ncbi:hypothetical protein QOZ80_2BG0155980 [Eleusine coracana subsp. coracana]|nr:hypothetical protein QOZ80_2BG0155980 [Eleusine coracana subsp. coracana]